MGTLSFKELPAYYNGERNKIMPPAEKFIWSSEVSANSSPQHLLGFISRATQLTEEDAFLVFDSMIKEIKESLDRNGEWKWQHLGKLFMLSKEVIGFVPDGFYATYFPPLPIPEPKTAIRDYNRAIEPAAETLENKIDGLDADWEIENEGRWWIPSLVLALLIIGLIVARLTNWW